MKQKGYRGGVRGTTINCIPLLTDPAITAHWETLTNHPTGKHGSFGFDVARTKEVSTLFSAFLSQRTKHTSGFPFKCDK